MSGSRSASPRRVRSRAATLWIGTALGFAGSLLVVQDALAVPSFATGSDVCQVSDARIIEGSGLVVRPDGFDVVNDSGDAVVIYHLDKTCQVSGQTIANPDPLDAEDLVLGPDGSLWVADLGDNNAVRESVAVEIVDPGNPAAGRSAGSPTRTAGMTPKPCSRRPTVTS